MSGVHVRVATLADEPALRRALGDRPYFRWRLASASATEVSLLALLGGSIVGYGHLGQVDEAAIQRAAGDIPCLYHLEIAESLRNKGLGSSLLPRIEDYVGRKMNRDVVIGGADVDNPAGRRFFARNGWEVHDGFGVFHESGAALPPGASPPKGAYDFIYKRLGDYSRPVRPEFLDPLHNLAARRADEFGHSWAHELVTLAARSHLSEKNPVYLGGARDGVKLPETFPRSKFPMRADFPRHHMTRAAYTQAVRRLARKFGVDYRATRELCDALRPVDPNEDLLLRGRARLEELRRRIEIFDTDDRTRRAEMVRSVLEAAAVPRFGGSTLVSHAAGFPLADAVYRLVEPGMLVIGLQVTDPYAPVITVKHPSDPASYSCRLAEFEQLLPNLYGTSLDGLVEPEVLLVTPEDSPDIPGFIVDQIQSWWPGKVQQGRLRR